MCIDHLERHLQELAAVECVLDLALHLHNFVVGREELNLLVEGLLEVVQVSVAGFFYGGHEGVMLD